MSCAEFTDSLLSENHLDNYYSLFEPINIPTTIKKSLLFYRDIINT